MKTGRRLGSGTERTMVARIRMARLALALALGLTAPAASAVVPTTGDGSGNTAPPADDPGFANVGYTFNGTNGTSGVYLGNGWVLTAGHVGLQPIAFGGAFYDPIPGSRVVLQTGGTAADLALYRILGHPNLPDVTIAQTGVSANDEVVMIGWGWTRQTGLTYWDATFGEVPEAQAVYTGYKRASKGVARWGRNRVDAIDQSLAGPSTETRIFVTTFDAPGIADEAQVVPGDSGGAAFVKRGGTWELVGVLVAREIYATEGQPPGSAVFGNLSYVGDVAWYSDQILPLVSEPLPKISALPPPALAVVATTLVAAARRPLRAIR
jgi:hypothetical protein